MWGGGGALVGNFKGLIEIKSIRSNKTVIDVINNVFEIGRHQYFLKLKSYGNRK